MILYSMFNDSHQPVQCSRLFPVIEDQPPKEKLSGEKRIFRLEKEAGERKSPVRGKLQFHEGFRADIVVENSEPV